MKRAIVVSMAMLMVLSAVVLADAVGAFIAFKDGFLHSGQGPPMLAASGLTFEEIGLGWERASIGGLVYESSGIIVSSTWTEQAIIGLLATNVVMDSWLAETITNAPNIGYVAYYLDPNDFDGFTIVLVDLVDVQDVWAAFTTPTPFAGENLNYREVEFVVFILTFADWGQLQAAMASASAAVNAYPCRFSSVAELRSSLMSALTADERVMGKFITVGATSSTMLESAEPKPGEGFLDIARGLTLEEVVALVLHSGAARGNDSFRKQIINLAAGVDFSALQRSIPLIAY